MTKVIKDDYSMTYTLVGHTVPQCKLFKMLCLIFKIEYYYYNGCHHLCHKAISLNQSTLSCHIEIINLLSEIILLWDAEKTNKQWEAVSRITLSCFSSTGPFYFNIVKYNFFPFISLLVPRGGWINLSVVLIQNFKSKVAVVYHNVQSFLL